MNWPRMALLSIVLMCSQAAAHDFWLQPSEYWIDPNTIVAMTLQVGHGPFRQRSPIPAQRITRFQAVGPDGSTTEMTPRLHIGQPDEDGDLRFENAGVYVLVLQTDDRAQTHLPSIRFNDYLKAEGLTPALEQRARLHQTDADASERYSRCAKSLVRVRGSSAAGRQATAPLGLPLEIVPEVNPYQSPRAASLPIRVLYFGQPLSGALVKLTHLEHDAEPVEVHLTDGEGHAQFMMPESGTWLLNVIWTKVSGPSDETDFETVFSSLSFGFSSDARTP
jgi:uncharacterized GH25 family protein